jgi:hypothetical protein
MATDVKTRIFALIIGIFLGLLTYLLFHFEVDYGNIQEQCRLVQIWTLSQYTYILHEYRTLDATPPSEADKYGAETNNRKACDPPRTD